MTDNRTTELESLSKLKMAGRLRYWRGTIEIPEIELHAICDEIQAEYDNAVHALNKAAGNWAKADAELREKGEAMTDNRTTELLRKLLDERGVSCQTHYLHASWRVGSKLYEAMDNLDGTLTVGNLTPEQAIAATLGNHPTKSGRGYYTDRDDEGTHIMCDDCGGYIGTVEEIAATLESDTCSMEYGGDVTESTKRVLGVYFCSECGSPIYNDCMPYYCMYCGRKVVRA